MCGVASTFGMLKQRVAPGGSFAKTSSPAPATLPDASAGAARLVDQLAARAVDDPHAVLHLGDRLGVDQPRVSGVSATCRLM
jgi:hypothetical protein